MNGINSEKNSSSSDKTENFTFDYIPDENLDAEEITGHQNANRSTSPEFASRLSSGEQLFRSAIGLPDSYHVSAEHKLLFSTVSPNPANPDFPSLHPEGIFFDTFGLEVGDTRYPFSPDYQTAVHEAILKHELSDAANVDEAYNRLDNGFSMYFIENILRERNTEEINQELSLKRLAMMEKKTKLNKEQRGYRNKEELNACRTESERKQTRARQEQEFVSYILSNGIMNGRELERYEMERNFSLKTSANSIANKFGNIYKANHPLQNEENEKNEENKKEYEANLNKIKSHISELASDYLNALALSQVQSLPNKPELHLFDAEWTKKHIEDSIKSKLDKETTQRIFNDGRDADYFKEKLYEGFIGYGKLEGMEHVMKLLKDKEQKCLAHYGLLVSKYVDASIHYKKHNDRQIAELENRIKYLDDHKASIVERTSNERTWLTMKKIRERILSVVSPEDLNMPENIVNFYFIPTGIITRFKTGPLKTTMITPLDKRILDTFDDEEIKNAWVNAWSAKQTDYNKVALSVLQADMDANLVRARDEDDNEIVSFEAANQIQTPKAFNALTGRIYGDLQPEVLRSVEPLVPDVKDFIYGLDISATEVSKTLKSTRLEILNFLSGDSNGDELMLCGHGNLKINSIYELLINTEPEKRDKAHSRLLSEVGIMIYAGLSKGKTIEYRELIGDAADVSDTAFYQAYGKMIPNSTVRRRIVERTVFLKDFIDYIEDETTPAKTDFFNSLKKKPVIKG